MNESHENTFMHSSAVAASQKMSRYVYRKTQLLCNKHHHHSLVEPQLRCHQIDWSSASAENGVDPKWIQSGLSKKKKGFIEEDIPKINLK